MYQLKDKQQNSIDNINKTPAPTPPITIPPSPITTISDTSISDELTPKPLTYTKYKNWYVNDRDALLLCGAGKCNHQICESRCSQINRCYGYSYLENPGKASNICIGVMNRGVLESTPIFNYYKKPNKQIPFLPTALSTDTTTNSDNLDKFYNPLDIEKGSAQEGADIGIEGSTDITFSEPDTESIGASQTQVDNFLPDDYPVQPK